MTTRYFDYETVAREAGIPPEVLHRLCTVVRRDFPADDMMYELHVLGACMAVKDGRCSIQDVLDDTVRGCGPPSGNADASCPRGEA